MSAYTPIQCPQITNIRLLKKALAAALNVREQDMLFFEKGTNLKGYRQETQRAHLVLAGTQHGKGVVVTSPGGYNDVGFERVETDGVVHWVPHVPDHDGAFHDTEWLRRTLALYAEEMTMENAIAEGYGVEKTVLPDGRIQLVCSRYS